MQIISLKIQYLTVCTFNHTILRFSRQPFNMRAPYPRCELIGCAHTLFRSGLERETSNWRTYATVLRHPMPSKLTQLTELVVYMPPPVTSSSAWGPQKSAPIKLLPRKRMFLIRWTYVLLTLFRPVYRYNSHSYLRVVHGMKVMALRPIELYWERKSILMLLYCKVHQVSRGLCAIVLDQSLTSPK